MDLRHLRYVIVLAEELHFRRAADRLNISQPPLSRQIRLIERELGVQLFHRTRKEVRMTDAGQKFVDEARQVIAQFDYATSVAVRAQRGELGRLMIGTVSTQKTLLTDCVRVFAQRFPDVRLEFQSICTEGQLVALQAKTIEVGFLVLPVHAEGITLQTVSSEPMLLGLPSEHPLAAKREVPLQALAGQPMITFPRAHCIGFYDRLMKLCGHAGVQIRVAHEVTSLITGLALVEAGLGMCLFPASMAEYGSDQVVFRKLTPALPPVEHALAYRSSDDSGVLRAFLAVADEVFTHRGLRSVIQPATKATVSASRR